MSKIAEYREALNASHDWLPYLLANSGLPGPRGNLELAQAVAELATRPQLDALLKLDQSHPPENTPETFVVFCAIKGLGKFASEDLVVRKLLRAYARDPRWRIREAVAMSLQLWGLADIQGVIGELRGWIQSDPLEMRAVAAGLCEPALLREPGIAIETLNLLDDITRTIPTLPGHSSEAFRTLRQGLAYCWSVAVAAYPAHGKPLMEKWIEFQEKDIQWIMAENLKKNRLLKMDPAWAQRNLQKIRG
jgi:hypothetical protein